MARAGKRLATEETLQTLAKNATLLATNTALGNLAKDTTLQGTNTALGLLGKDATLQTLGKDATLQAIAEILASVKSVNGKYGVVVLDSGDILITNGGSKTVKQVLTELETAVGHTPLTFTPTLISGDDYKIVVATGTPS